MSSITGKALQLHSLKLPGIVPKVTIAAPSDFDAEAEETTPIDRVVMVVTKRTARELIEGHDCTVVMEEEEDSTSLTITSAK
jgi:hypothetical protein